MGYRKRTGFLSGLMISQVSEFSLILAALGVGVGHIGSDAMGLITTTGLVTIRRCGHWWAYRFDMSRDQMHGLAEFNLGVTCSLCISDWQAVARAHARGTATRVN